MGSPRPTAAAADKGLIASMLTRWELFCLTGVYSWRVMVWNCSQQSSTVELVAPSEIEINWLRERAEQHLVNLTLSTVGPRGSWLHYTTAQKRKRKTHLRIWYFSIRIKASKVSTDILYFNCSKTARRGNLISLWMILLEPPSLASLSLYFASRVIFLIRELSRSNSQAQEFILSLELEHFKFYTLAFSLLFIIHQSLRARFSVYRGASGF